MAQKAANRSANRSARKKRPTPSGMKAPGRQPSRAQAQRAEALAAVRREQARRERRRRLLAAGGGVLAVLLVAGVIVAVGLHHSRKTAATTAIDPAVQQAVGSVPASTYDAVGVGSVTAYPEKITGDPLTADGKPRVLYVGAEYCPYCAAERWALVAALSRFGTFSSLRQTESSGDDVFPNTRTLSFHGASFTSDYLSFTGVETASNQRQGSGYAPLDKLSSDDEKVFQKYDVPPLANNAGGIPFLDIANALASSGASYTPELLKGMTHQQIADAMADPTTKVAQAVDGAANVLTAAMCRATDGKPGAVCDSAGVKAADAKLPS